MNGPTDPHPVTPESDDRVSLLEIASMVLRHWRIVVWLPLVLGLVVGIWSITRDRTYAASASFMPQAAERRGPSGAAALAQQFGLNLGNEGSGQSPQFYVELLRSRTLLRQAVESEYELPRGERQTWKGTLIEFWDLNEESGILPPWHQATEKLSNAISTSVSRETGVVQLTIVSGNPVVAEKIAEKLLTLLNEFNLEVRQGRAQDEGRFIDERITEARAELRAAEGALQNFLRQNREFRNSPELSFEHERLQRQVLMRQEVYTSLLRSQEQTRIDAVRDLPLLTVIDHPEGSAEPQGRGTIARAMVAFILGLVLAVLIAFIREAAHRTSQARDPDYREFRGLARQAWHDVRHPGRWLRRT